jgi:inner membrane protein
MVAPVFADRNETERHSVDVITHSFLGAAAAQSAFTRRLGRTAAIAGAIGGFVPDLDMLLTPLADPALPNELHRAFTHAIVFIPVGGAIATLPLMLWKSLRAQWFTVYAAATLGCATHALNDCLTAYGTMWYWPFSREFVAWDILPIIDPLFTLPLIVAVVWAWKNRTIRPALIGLTWCVLYVLFALVQRERGLAMQRQIAEERGHVVERGRVKPTLGNTIIWRSIYEHDGRFYADGLVINPFGQVQVETGRSIQRLVVDDLPPPLRENPRVADGYIAAQPAYIAEGEGVMVIGDMRYSRDRRAFAPLWGLQLNPHDPEHPVTWVGWRTPGAMAQSPDEVLEERHPDE